MFNDKVVQTAQTIVNTNLCKTCFDEPKENLAEWTGVIWILGWG